MGQLPDCGIFLVPCRLVARAIHRGKASVLQSHAHFDPGRSDATLSRSMTEQASSMWRGTWGSSQDMYLGSWVVTMILEVVGKTYSAFRGIEDS